MWTRGYRHEDVIVPLVKTDEYQVLADKFALPEQEQEEVSQLDKIKAAFEVENTLGAALVRQPNMPSDRLTGDLDVWEALTDDERQDEGFLDAILEVDTQVELDAVRAQRDRERSKREMLQGVDGALYSMLAGTFDPINFIPVGGVAYKTYRAGGSILRNGMITASVAGGSSAATEAILHSQQLERTFGESAANVTAATVLGLVLGAGAAKLSKAQHGRLTKEIEETLDIDKPLASPIRTDKSIGASAAWKDIEIKGKTAKSLAKSLAFDPLTRTLTRSSQKAKQLLVQLTENPFVTDGFSGQSVESAAKVRRDSLLWRGKEAHNRIFKEYKKNGGKLKIKEFNKLAASEMRNPGTVTDPHIQRSAAVWKSKVYDPQLKAIQDAGLLPEDVQVKTAAQYLNRRWNRYEVAAKLPKFLDTVSTWLVQRQPGLDSDEARDIAKQIAGRITSSPDGMLPYDYQIGGKKHPVSPSKLKGPFKPRVFDIEDAMVEEFLDNDIEKLAGIYLRQTSTDVELINKFGDSKSDPNDVIELKQQLKDIEDEYSDLMENAKTEKERLKLRSEKEKAKSDLKGMLDRMRGVYDMPDPDNILHRFMHAARNLNFLRFMGGVTISSISDSARLIMADGLNRAFGSVFRPLIHGLKKSKLVADDVHYWGIGTDAITGGRLEVISDINDYALGGTKLERGLQSLANSFGNINLMNQWTSLMKTSHAIGMQTHVMDQLVKGKIDPRLKRLGIDDADAKAILKQVKTHGSQDAGAWIYNAKDWDDQALAMRWAMALKKESDRVIIVPGQERPLFMSRETGKTLLQFKSFMMAATQRILIAGLQGQDKHMVQGLVAMVGLGALTYVIKQVEAGRPVSDDPATWIKEGIDRSGAIGILMEINNSIEKVSSNRFGLGPLMGSTDQASRYATRSWKEALLGPTWGSMTDNVFRILNAASSEHPWTEGDTSAFRRLMPYQNLFGVRTGLNYVEDAFNEAID